MTTITACIPYFNNKDTINAVINSIKSQDISIQEIIIWDDGSKTSPSDFLYSADVRIKKNSSTQGRGSVRNALCKEANSEFILFCDATNSLPTNFVSMGITHFMNKKCAAVSGLIVNDGSLNGTPIRWRGRHLFKETFEFGTRYQDADHLTTYGTLMRRSTILAIGNFNKSLRHSEDKELGKRLIDAGYKIIGDPRLYVSSKKKDSWLSVLERYWRWYGGVEENMNFPDYLHSIKASFKPMIKEDLRAKDISAALLSFVCPHYGYARAKVREIKGKIERYK